MIRIGEYTTVEACDTYPLRMLVASVVDQLQWRWHGIGVLQAYINPAAVGDGGKLAPPSERDRELRVHIWSPRFILDGIAESGSVHDHRFNLVSTVLVGQLLHTEYRAIPDPAGEHDIWDFISARHHTDANRADMRALHQPHCIEFKPLTITAGQRYTFERGQFHSSRPLTDVVVSLVEKRDQVKTRARVLAPIDSNPVPAFGYDNDELGKRGPASLIAEARRLLLEGIA